jgi:hypothetical protein
MYIFQRQAVVSWTQSLMEMMNVEKMTKAKDRETALLSQMTRNPKTTWYPVSVRSDKGKIATLDEPLLQVSMKSMPEGMSSPSLVEGSK